MKKLYLLQIALLILAAPGIVSAALLTASSNPSDLGDLDHDTLWTWRIDGVNLGGYHVASASITLAGIYNWQDEANRLFIHLFDTVPNAGTAHRSDVSDGIHDYFLSPATSFAPAPGTSNVLLTAPSFPGGWANRTDYTYIFTPDQLAILQGFIANNGDFAFGLDPDCHYYNSGISFQMTTAHAPEPGTWLLVGLGLLLGGPMLRRIAQSREKTALAHRTETRDL